MLTRVVSVLFPGGNVIEPPLEIKKSEKYPNGTVTKGASTQPRARSQRQRGCGDAALCSRQV